ncbi:response regulator transcription factor [Thalassotalea atypica]|uniref:response regulator transcription factor n=1 Tax=Thalassotalea atypica TaxID=2054316 RepID=UPI00257283DB|nr:LuxR C-terminal-related transcriptional regulator [Thalassotalea atypica]
MSGLFDTRDEESFDVYLSSLSNKLMTSSLANTKQVINEIILDVIKRFGIDRVTLFPASQSFVKDGNAISVAQDGVPKLPSTSDVENMDPYLTYLNSSKLAVKFDRQQLQNTDIEVLQKLYAQGMCWHCVLPLKMFGVIWGGFAIGQFDENKEPIPEHYFVRLKLIGEMCASYWKFSELLTEQKFHQQAMAESEDALSVLSLKQREIISLLATGYTAKEIGEKLFLSSRTIESHKYRIMDTLSLNSHSELVQFAVKNGLILTQ